MAGPFTPFGATGRFPRGKLHDSDEGELRMGVTVKDGTVVVAFGKPVAWLGLPPATAREFARTILEKADEAAKVQ